MKEIQQEMSLIRKEEFFMMINNTKENLEYTIK